MKQGQPAQQSAQPQVPPQQPQVPPQQSAQPQVPPQQPQVPPQQSVTPQQVAAAPAPPGAKLPLDALQNAPQQPVGQQVNVVEVEGQQNNVVQQAQVMPGQPVQEDQALPTDQGETVEDQTAIEESLEELKEEYDDAKLNSIIIEQVKELIEIDTNLNNKIEDMRIDLKKETEERERLEKKIDDNHAELKDLEKSIDKFIALYELVTNQFNPFVRQDDPETKKKMEALMKQVQQVPAPAEAAPVQEQAAAEDVHFVTKSGARVKDLAELTQLLETMPDEEFSHHVTPDKNDFATWIEQALQNPKLSEIISPLKTKNDMLAALKKMLETDSQSHSGIP